MSSPNAVRVGPPHCDRHTAHHVGCLACAQAVCEAGAYDLDEFLDLMEHIGWPAQIDGSAGDAS